MEKTYRRRLILSCIVVIATQNTGILVINSFNALLYQSLGLSNSQALIVSAGYNTWGMVANFLGATISDRFGRRRLLGEFSIWNAFLILILTLVVIGFGSTLAMFVVATGLIAKYTETGTKTWAGLSLTFLFLYVFWYVRMRHEVTALSIAAAMPHSSMSTAGRMQQRSSRLIFGLKELQLGYRHSS